jgi:tetratricopeptide (TPR) repeat protein
VLRTAASLALALALAGPGRPDDLEGLLERGRERLARGEAGAALEELAREEGRHGSDARYLAFVGFLLERTGRLDEALERYAAAGARAPADPYPVQQRGALLARLRRYGEAEALYREWLARHPGDPMAVEALEYVREEQAHLKELLAVERRLRRLTASAAVVLLVLVGATVFLSRRARPPAPEERTAGA